MARKFLTPINVASQASPPATGTAGDVYYNTVDKKLYTYDGVAWVGHPDFTSSATSPASPSPGDFWLDSVNGDLYVYYQDINSSQWISAGTSAGPPGAQGPTGPAGPTGPDGVYVVSVTAPTGPVEGDVWFDSVNVRYYIYYDGYWVETTSSVIGPTGPTGPTGATGPTGSNTLLALTDTTITSPSAGDQLVYNGTNWVNRPEPGRNLLYNGAMQVHQRGTSVAGITTSGYYTADRWGTVIGGQGTWTQTVENDAPTGSGFRKSIKILCTTADATPSASDTVRIRQTLEGQDVQRIAKGTASAQQLTLSFWVKSNLTGTYIAELNDNDNTRQVSATYTISSSETWERKTITFPADTTGAFDNDNALSLITTFWLGAGSDRTSGTLPTTWASAVTANTAVGQTNLAAAINNYWQVTGVQLEVGTVATPFEFKSFGQELAECQRYYYRITNDGFKPFGFGGAISATNLRAFVSFPVTMRIPPTSIDVVAAGLYSCLNATGTDLTFTVAPALDQGSIAGATVQGTVASGLVAGNATQVRANNAGNAILGFNAEL